jgi:hypothetical protein
MENASGDLRRALGGPILGRQMLEVTHHAVENLLNLTHTTYNCGNDLEMRAKCIISYLSMDVPRSWWEQAMNTGELDESYFSILRDLRNELLKIDQFSQRADFGLIVALAFVDNNDENKEEKYNIFDSQYSVEKYLTDAEIILTTRNDIQKLADKMNKQLPTLI